MSHEQTQNHLRVMLEINLFFISQLIQFYLIFRLVFVKKKKKYDHIHLVTFSNQIRMQYPHGKN
jgi:hypothetical protein